MKRTFAICLFLCIIGCISHAQKAPQATPGPVFDDMGPVYDVPMADFVPDQESELKAIFDIDRKQDDPSEPNPIITSLHRFYNMHVRNGIPEENIHLAFVVHGASNQNILTDKAYKSRYGVANPNIPYINALKEKGVNMYICGQSATYAGYDREEILPEVSVSLSAMTILTIYQMDGYGMIKF